MKETCAIYHWWDYEGDPPPYSNLRVPTIVSIATLRSVNENIPIIVLDITEDEKDWGKFKEKLNFSVHKVKPNLKKHKSRIPSWRYLSRLIDVNNFAKNMNSVMYVDSDIFWIKDPIPLEQNNEKMCFDKWNGGFYYYNPQSKDCNLFFEIFDAYLKSCIFSKDIKNIMTLYQSWHEITDEMIMSYMSENHSELFNIISKHENFTANHIDDISDKTKMFHCNCTAVGNNITKKPNEKEHCRGILGLLLKEFYDNMSKVLTKEDLLQIYSEEEMDFYLKKQISLFKEKKIIKNSKSSDGQFHADKWIKTTCII